MLTGSLVELHVGLHLCLCFSHLEKLLLKACSTPPRYLFNTLLSIEFLQLFSYRNPDSFSTPGGSIKKVPASSIASGHLVDWSSFCSWFWWVVPRYLLNTSAVDKHFLNTSSTDTSIPTFVEIYCLSYFSSCAIRFSFPSISLLILLCLSPKNTQISLQSWFLKDSSSFFKFFFTW